MTLERWRALWRALGAVSADETLYAELTTRYAEPRRHYHSLRHLEECLAHLDAALDDGRSAPESAAEVECALWFHDAVLDPLRSDNELRSAEWAQRSIREAGVDAATGERIAALILATRHDAVPATDDARWVADVDLAILGADATRFPEYERQVRAEYSGVPGILFRRRRRAILEGLLTRDPLFETPYFHERYETRARANLKRSVAKLKE